MRDLTKEIEAYALKNAIEFGKADAGRILPKLFQHGLDKRNIKEVMPVIQDIIQKVNALSSEQLTEKFNVLKNYVKKHEEKEKTLPELPNAVVGKVVTRMPPEPSKYAHIGHAITFILNYIYAKRYRGKCLLRLEDANPIKITQEYVDAMIADIEDYLGIEPDEIRYVSDDIPYIYELAGNLITMNKAFMCFCDRETMQNFRHEGRACTCRKNDVKTVLKEWSEFLHGTYKAGEAVLRLKGNMKDTNHVMRDPVIFRKIDAQHFRQGSKYSVWPTYEFYSPIEEHLMGTTHIIRSNEFEDRVPLQELIKELLGLKKQTIIQYGRINVIDATTKGRDVRELIESGEYSGWDDPRLVTLRALKRRGITREAFYELVKQLGFAKHQVNLDFNMIAAINRKILDKRADRYYFVANPVEISVKGLPEKLKEIKAKLHPDREDVRKIVVGKKIFITKADSEAFRGTEIRLMNLCNVELIKKPVCTGVENKPIQKIQWVSDKAIQVKVMMDNGRWIKGLGEPALQKVKIGNVIQMERFGFVRLDKKTKAGLEFWFTHR